MQDAEAAAELKKRRTFRKFSYRGIDLDQYVLATIFLQAG
jgi:small subunit ribosomal protein S15e